MRVLHVIWDLGQGGAQRYLHDLLTELNGKIDNDVLVLAGPGPLSGDVKRYCTALDYLYMKGGWNPIDLFRLIRYLKNTQADLIHSHSSNVLFNLALHVQSLPVVYTEHGGCLLGRHIADRMIYKILHRPIRRYIAISGYMAGVMASENEAIKERIKIIYNGVDIKGINATPSASQATLETLGLTHGRKVGFVGRLVSLKGVEYFIETARHVSASLPDAHFIIIGDGPLAGTLKALVRKYKINDKVHFLGYRKDVFTLMKSFDVLLFTSRYEGFGLVIAEAMAAGVPVVAMNSIGAVSEIIRHGIDGIVVKGLDAETAAAEIVRLLENPESRKCLAANAQERVRAEFSIAQNARKIETEYRSVLGIGETGRCS